MYNNKEYINPTAKLITFNDFVIYHWTENKNKKYSGVIVDRRPKKRDIIGADKDKPAPGYYKWEKRYSR